MRSLTFNKFLKQYLVDVSGQPSFSVHKLAKLSKKNIRIVDPLILYCLFEDKMEICKKYLNLDDVLKTLNKNNYLDDRYSNYSFQKIHQSYVRKTNSNEYDLQTKTLIRNNIMKMMNDKDISKYRVYTDLSLNPGNVNDYLTNGNSKKVSLELVKIIYNYCRNYR